MTKLRKWHVAAIAAAIAALAGVALAAPFGASGVGINVIEVRTQTSLNSTNSTSYVNVPGGANADVTVDEGNYIRVRFAGESRCGGEDSSPQTCSMRIVLSPSAAVNPKSGLDLAFDSFDGHCCSDPTPEAHAMEWISEKLAAGTYTVKTQYAVSTPNISFQLDDWTFTAEEVEALPSD